MKRIVASILLLCILLLPGCSIDLEEANQAPSVDGYRDMAIEFEKYKQQTDERINDLQKTIKEQEGRINVLTARVEKLESEIWKIDGDDVEYYNETYDFGFYLPRELMENAIVETEVYEEGTSVIFNYSGYKHESGIMQAFFSVYITSQEQEVRGCGEEVCTPYMIQNDKAYYITLPIDSILPAKKSVHYSKLTINEYELIGRRMTVE